MASSAKILCPLNGKPCIEDGTVVDGELVACRFWVNVRGKNPQTGAEIDTGDCAICWIPVLLIENSKEQRTTHAEVEKLRNETVPATNQVAAAMSGMLRLALDSKQRGAQQPQLEDGSGQITVIENKGEQK